MTKVLSINVPAASLYKSADESADLETECLFGEQFEVIEKKGDWIRGCLLTDGYSGWIKACAAAHLPPATHRVVAIRTVLTAGVGVKTRTVCALSMGACVSVLDTAKDVSRIEMDGSVAYIATRHIAPLDNAVGDWVGTAEKFIDVPYRWGGRDSLGLDCSALVQLALQSAGISSPRNSSDQQSVLGQSHSQKTTTAPWEYLRGDLVFWPGHVGIMIDDTYLLHANAHHRRVAIESLKNAVSRILATEGVVTCVNRLTI